MRSEITTLVVKILESKLSRAIVGVSYTSKHERICGDKTKDYYFVRIISRVFDLSGMEEEICDLFLDGIRSPHWVMEQAVLSWLHVTYPPLRDLDLEIDIENEKQRIDERLAELTDNVRLSRLDVDREHAFYENADLSRLIGNYKNSFYEIAMRAEYGNSFMDTWDTRNEAIMKRQRLKTSASDNSNE